MTRATHMTPEALHQPDDVIAQAALGPDALLMKEEYEQYDTDTFTDRYIQRNIVNAIVRDSALHALADGEFDADFVATLRESAQQKSSELQGFLVEKNHGNFTADAAQQKAEDFLEKTISYYSKHNVLEGASTSKNQKPVGAIRSIGSFAAYAAAEKIAVLKANLASIRKPADERSWRNRGSRNFFKKGFPLLAVGTFVIIGANVLDSIATNSSSAQEEAPTPAEEVYEIETEASVADQEPVTTPPISAAEQAEESDTEFVETTTASTTPASTTTSTTTPTTTTIPAPETTIPPVPYTPETDTVRALQSGEIDLADMQGVRIVKLKSDKLCLDNVLVYGSNRADLSDKDTLNKLQAEGLLSTAERAALNLGTASSTLKADIQQRFDRIYEVREQQGAQEDCGSGIGTAEYPARWARSTQGSTLADTMALQGTKLADITPIVELDTRAGIPGMPGNAVIAGHRTTGPAPLANIDSLVPGDTMEIVGDDDVLYTYRAEAIEKVIPDKAGYEQILQYESPSGIKETMTVYTCDDGSETRYIVRFVLDQA